jgi:hypothetical protein
MSTMVAVHPRYIRGHALPAPAKPEMKRYTLLAVQQGEQWASLCRELDIASSGATAEEALDTLECPATWRRSWNTGAARPSPRRAPSRSDRRLP